MLPEVEVGKWHLGVFIFDYTKIHQLQPHLMQCGYVHSVRDTVESKVPAPQPTAFS